MIVLISKVKKHQVDSTLIAGFELDAPNENFNIGDELFRFQGWVVSKGSPVEKVDVFLNEFHSLSIPMNVSRPDVAAVFPDCDCNVNLGYYRLFNVTMLPEEFKIDIAAKFKDGTGAMLFSIWGTNPLKIQFSPEIKPLALTSLGRSGSSLMLALLGFHPEIVVYRPYEEEARYISYWMQIFLSLGDPKSWVCPLAADERGDPAWVLGNPDSFFTPKLLPPELVGWFSAEYTQELFGFCMQNMINFYRNYAESINKKDIVYFAEKMTHDTLSKRIGELIPQSKEILLVRDFRDVYCSIRAFNQKRNVLAFGREAFDSDEQYISMSLAYSAEQLSNLWKLKKNRICLVKYEDLVLRPEMTLQNIFEYLGIDANINIVKDIINKSREFRKNFQDQHKTSASGEASIGRYKTDLSPEMIDVCNRAFNAALTEFEYDI